MAGAFPVVPQSPRAYSPRPLVAAARDNLREHEGNGSFQKLFVEEGER